jgi:hypothetical protein
LVSGLFGFDYNPRFGGETQEAKKSRETRHFFVASPQRSFFTQRVFELKSENHKTQ